MLSQRTIETWVGVFLLSGILALVGLAFKVSGLTEFLPQQTYTITALFDDIGQLKVRAPVKMGGVQIGSVSEVKLDPATFKALVKMRIADQYNDIPDDSSASIMTAGLLGDNYIAITPMYSGSFLKAGSQIQYTHSALILENLIGKFLFKVQNNNIDNSKGESDAKE